MSPLYVASRKYLVGCSCAPGTTENGPLENCWLGLIRAGPSVCVSNNATIHHTHLLTFYTTGGKKFHAVQGDSFDHKQGWSWEHTQNLGDLCSPEESLVRPPIPIAELKKSIRDCFLLGTT